jgi:hypothetical protein
VSGILRNRCPDWIGIAVRIGSESLSGLDRTTQYVSPLREGGSLPGLVEADDFGTYVVKFTGAGLGRKALVAEVVAGELGRRLGLRVPDQVAIDLDAEIARYEADQEVQDLLAASAGLDPHVDVDAVAAALRAIEAVCAGDVAAGPPASLTVQDRFGWLSAPKSTVVQPGPVHGGMAADPAGQLQHLLDALVT